MQSEPEKTQSQEPVSEPQQEVLKREDSAKNKIHPLVSPPQVHLGDATPVVKNSDFPDEKEADLQNDAAATLLSPANEKV